MQLLDIKDFAITIAAFSSIYVGISGLKTWKRQLKGNNEYNLAVKAIVSLYELREVVIQVRNPFYQLNVELPAYDVLCKFDTEQWEQLDSYNIRKQQHELLKMIKIAERNLKSCLTEIDVALGDNLQDKIEPISILINEFIYAKNEVWLYNIQRAKNNTLFNEKDHERIKNLEKITYRDIDDKVKDDFMEKFEIAILGVKNALEFYLK